MIGQVDNETIAELMRIRHAIEPAGAVGEADEGRTHPWAALLEGFAHQDVLDAVWAHYAHEARAVWPADVIVRLEALAVERRQAAQPAKEAAQEGQSEFSGEDKAAWNLVWDEAISRGESARNAQNEADKSVTNNASG